MKRLGSIAALLLLAGSVAEAQVPSSSGQTSIGQATAGQAQPAPATPDVGATCIEEIAGTFCSSLGGEGSGGYGTSGPSAGGSSVSPSIPTCGGEPPANELCD